MNQGTDPELESIRKRKMEQLQKMVEMEQQKKNWPSSPVHVNDASLQDMVKKFPVVLVDFWAQWCAPCKMIGPILDQLASEYQGRIVIAKLDVDDDPGASRKFSVQGIPTLIMFKDGSPAERITGALPRNTLKALIDRYLQ